MKTNGIDDMKTNGYDIITSYRIDAALTLCLDN